MFLKTLKILPVVCLLAAQLIVAGHVHHDDEAFSDEQCVYCQMAAELSGMDIPQAIVPLLPVRIETPQKISANVFVSSQTFCDAYHSRAPPVA